jgi:hypothetical protein
MDTFADYRMARQRKRKAPLGWWLTVAQIRREFRNVYPTHEKLPPQLRALANELERKIQRGVESRRSTRTKDTLGRNFIV